MTSARGRLAIALVALVAACGNAYAEDERPAPGPTVDAGPDAPPLPTASCDALDFQRALFVVPEGETCPPGATERLLVTGGTPAAEACSCGACTTLTAPSCVSNESVTNSFGNSNACSGGTNSYVINADNACLSAGGTFNAAPFNGWPLRKPTPGSCSAAAIADPGKVTSTALRSCVPDSQAMVCAAITARRRLCTESLGGGCGGDFPLAVSAGDRVEVTCAACGCKLESDSCVVEYHGNSACTNLKYTTALDGVCKATNGAPNVSHTKFYPSPAQCVTTPGPASAALVGAKQYCCTP